MEKPEGKTKEQLLNEIHELRAKIVELENHKTSDLTEIKIAEKTVIDERNKAQQCLDIADVMLVSLDPEGIVQLINPKGCEILGYTKEEMLGQNWFDLVLPENQRETVKKVAKKVFSGETESVKYYENNIVTKSGEERLIAFHNSVFMNEHGKIIGTLSSGEDITEQKKIQESLIKAQSFNETLLETSPDIIYVYDLVESKNIYSNEGITKILGYSIVEIKELGDQLISSLMNKDDFQKYINETIPLYQNAKDGEIIEHEYRMKHKNGEWRWLLSKESIFQRMADGSPKQIFGMISNITERKLAEDELLQSEQKFKLLVTNIEEIIYLVDKDGIFTISEGKGLEKLGLKPGQVVGMSVLEFYKDYPDILVGIRKALNGETTSMEVQVGPNYFTNWITPQFNLKGEVIGLIGLAINITDRKKAENELRKSEEKFRQLLQSIPLPVVYVNNEGEFTFRNDRFVEVFGYTDVEVPGIDEWWQKAYPDETYRQWVINNWNTVVKKASETGSDIESGIYQVTCMDGNVRDIIITGITINDEILATLIDITELKLAEAKLIKEKEYSEEMINALPGVFYQISNEGQFLNWNKDFEIVSGYSAEEMSKISPIDLFDGEDKKRIAESIAQVFSHGSVDVEANLTSKTGSKVPYFFTGKRIMIDALPVLVGMGMDVSELKKAENELKKHREQLEELVKERTKDLETKNKELDNAMKVFVGRELTIRNLQERIRALEGK